MRNKVVFVAAVVLFVAAATGERPDDVKSTRSDKVSHYEVLDKASVPSLINYQGYLTDNAGNAIDDTLEMTFSIWDAASSGSQLWNETQASVHVVNGLFNVLLGSITPIPTNVFTGSSLWLQTQVGTEILEPRKEIVSVGYVFRAAMADAADYADEAIYADTTDFAWATETATYADTSDFADSADVAGYAHGANWADSSNYAVYADSTGSTGPVAYADSADVAGYAHDAGYADTSDYAGYADSAGVMGPVGYADSAGVTGYAHDADMVDGQHASAFLSTANDWGRSGVATDLYEGTTKLSDKYVNETGPETMAGSSSDPILKATNTGSGPGLRGESFAYGVYGYVTGYSGYGVYGNSIGGDAVGARGYATGPFGKGLWGTATGSSGLAVYGTATGSSAYGGYFVSSGYRGMYAKGGGGNEAAYLDGDVTVKADLTVDHNISGGRLISMVSTGTAPLTVTSTTMVTNLNADLLDGQHASAFLSTANDWGRSGVATDLYEGTTKLTDKYLGKTAKAADADKLDGQHGSYYRDASNINAGTLDNARFSAYSDLSAEGRIGTGANQVAAGNHNHWNAIWVGSNTTYGLMVDNNSTGDGIRGYSDATDPLHAAVYGCCNSSGSGVYGRSVSGRGVYGYSSTDYGVYGQSGTGVGVYYSGGLAGTGSKSCVVKTSKGPTFLYCQESPENWFEDFGEGKLIDGRCHIELDPLFLETVTIDGRNPMKVFIQLNEDCNGTYVERSRTGFDVIELQGGKSNARFTYRVVAKRKGFEDKRLNECKAGYKDPYLYPELKAEIERKAKMDR